MAGSIRLLFIFAGTFLASTLSTAAAQDEIEAAALRTLMDNGKVLVINPLSPIEFNHEHISGSINIPIDQMSNKMPGDLHQDIVFYDSGEGCTSARMAVEQALRLGYSHSKSLRGGIPAWKAAGYAVVSSFKLPQVSIATIDTHQLEKMLATNDILLLDIRSTEENNRSRIDSIKCLHIPLSELHDRYVSLPKNKLIVIICQDGRQSHIAARFLAAKGFSRLSVVSGGMQRWLKEGRPVKKP